MRKLLQALNFNKKKKYELIAYTGKLPFKNEFIRKNMHLPQQVKLDHWLQRDFQKLFSNDQHRQLRQLYDQQPIYHFYSCATSGYQPIVGTFMASHDQSGRAYPFLIIRYVDNPVVHEYPSGIASFYADFYAQSYKICNNDWPSLSQDDLDTQLINIKETAMYIDRRHCLEKVVTDLKSVTLQTLYDTLPEPWKKHEPVFFFQKALKLLLEFKSLIDSNESHAISIPLPSYGPLAKVVAFWIQLFDALTAVDWSRMQVFWNYANQAKPASLVILSQPITSNEFIWLLNPNEDKTSRIKHLEISNLSITPDSRISQIVSDQSINLLTLMQLLGEIRDLS